MRSIHPFEQEEVMAYLDGEIPADRAAEIALHMQKCAECQALVANLQQLTEQLPRWEIGPAPAILSERVERAVEEHGRANTATGSERSRTISLLPQWIRVSPWKWVAAGLVGATASAVVLSVAWMASFSAGGGRGIDSLSRVVAHGGNASSHNRHAVAASAELAAPVPPVVEMQMRVGSTASVSAQLSDAHSAPMIARTASLSIVAKDFASVESAVKGVTARHSGYIGELNTAAPPDAAKSFSATLRIPSAQLDAALAELKQLGHVEQETQGGEEVTKQYTDLAARLKNSRATELRLLDVLRTNTGKVKDVLEVENEISRVRGEIEEMEADQRGLQSRIDFGTVTLSVAEEYKASLQSTPFSTNARLHNAFVTGYHSVVENVIGVLAWLLESGPTLLLWAALLFFPVRWIWKRVRRALTANPAAA